MVKTRTGTGRLGKKALRRQEKEMGRAASGSVHCDLGLSCVSFFLLLYSRDSICLLDDRRMKSVGLDANPNPVIFSGPKEVCRCVF